jgi:hypothetical protein
MHRDKLDRAKLMSLVEKYGYEDIAAALRERGGLPDPEQAYLTGGVEDIDDFSACKITRKDDWVATSPSPTRCGCGAHKTRTSSGAPASPKKPAPCSPRRKPRPSPPPNSVPAGPPTRHSPQGSVARRAVPKWHQRTPADGAHSGGLPWQESFAESEACL